MRSKMEKIVTRFAPSPTGWLHIGGARTALFTYIFAKKYSGLFILRIEDTDISRNRKEYEEEILRDLAWLNIKYDALYRQSERKEIYKGYLEKLMRSGWAYESQAEEIGEGIKKKAIRFKNPNKVITFQDLIRGQVEFDTTELEDFVIAKNLEEPLYHLAVVVDDYEMGVTHIIRAEEHISNTPRQILIQEALDIKRPVYAHLPLVLAPDRSKLSKRKHGEEASLKNYREKGYLPEAIINFLALLGWHPAGDKEILSLEEIIESFELEKVQKGGAVLNIEKLSWLNAQYLKKVPLEESLRIIKELIEKNKKESWKISEEKAEKIALLLLERIQRWGEVKEIIERGELDYFFEKPSLKKESLKWKKDNDYQKALKHLHEASEIVENLEDNDYRANTLKEKLMAYAGDDLGSVLWPLRYALAGREKSPNPFTMAEILGKKETLNRWKEAIEILKS